MAKIVLTDVWKRFDRVEAVRSVNLDIEDGEFVVLVGPSGCGKSTTLRMIAGLEDVSAGEIRFGDTVVNDMTPRERNIAMVFQSYALYPHMSVARNMAFALEQRKMPKAEIDELVRRTADLLNISELLERKPKALSGGQRQRVAMGRAIVRRPEVFLFDEPLSNLDAALRTQMRMEIKKLHQVLKTTVVYVTHDQIEAMTLADRIVVMDKGEVVQVGAPMEVYERPLTKFVAGFIGAPRMNFIASKVARAQGGLHFDLGEGRGWKIPGDAGHLAALENRPIEIGIRPEHLLEGPGEGPGTVSFEAAPVVVEPTGADTIVFFTLNGTEVCARCRPDWSIQPGRPMTFHFNFDRIHVIDPETGVVVRPAGQ
jgi:multiple sugar transport system ATP-binding protein